MTASVAGTGAAIVWRALKLPGRSSNFAYKGLTRRFSSCSSTAGAVSVTDRPQPMSLEAFGKTADHSWLRELSPDPETEAYYPNKSRRQVLSGHYVRVRPTPLPEAHLIIYSRDLLESLGIAEEETQRAEFASFFAGQQDAIPGFQSWCTPYALAISGSRTTQNCPFGTGNGYGDGRAISVAEVVVNGQRWELQLKGAGTTPFCRGFDGRAVLRSSIREFLASEAMHHLGVSTTRALCLVVSNAESVRRAWYSDGPGRSIDGYNDPDRLIDEPCAITTRVAPSFLRVGHIDLFARRAVGSDATDNEKQELIQIIEHALFREYGHIPADRPLRERAKMMLEEAAERMGTLAASWLRVGYCQGNFNSDNCLVGGRTMDYGPFGWIERYDPMFRKWIGAGSHYAFMNQANAMVANYFILVTSVAPILGMDKEGITELFQRGATLIDELAADTWRVKMGFSSRERFAARASSLWNELEPLMRRSGIDFTIFWRQLASVADLGEEDGKLPAALSEAFYEERPSGELATEWMAWLRKWREVVAEDEGGLPGAAERLRAVNPKYVPREWMLVEAYERAQLGDVDILNELYEVFQRPYEEQPEVEDKYYRRTPREMQSRGGVAFMS